MTEEHALYVRDGDAFVGTACTQGGWDPRSQSGGAVLALLGHLLEDIPVPRPSSLSRLTVDLVRPVPVGQRIWVDQEVVRTGRSIQVVDAEVRSADVLLGRARALRICDADLTDGPVPSSTLVDDDLLAHLPSPSEVGNVDDVEGMAGFLRLGTEFCRTATPTGEPDVAWVRLRVPVVAGEGVRPTSRATVVMDCVNLIGVTGLGPGVTAINPDVTGHVLRPPVGEWTGLVGGTRFEPRIGHGFSTALLVDEAGVWGTTSTSQVLQRLT
jgi:hypothetical protein